MSLPRTLGRMALYLMPPSLSLQMRSRSTDRTSTSTIIDSLESALLSAVVAITGKNPALCGALDPFPLIEDGGFTIPVASVSPADAWPLIDDAEATIAIRNLDRDVPDIPDSTDVTADA